MQYIKSNKTVSLFNGDQDLSLIANSLETDKGTADRNTLSWGSRYPKHFCMHYTITYEKYMSPSRLSNVNLFEVGICDRRFPYASPKMWATFFQNATLYALDNFWGKDFNPEDQDIKTLSTLGVDFIYGDQGSEQDWNAVEEVIPNNSLDFFVEDGSHYPHHMMYTLWRSIKLVKPGGYYFMEDIGTEKSRGWYGYDNTEIGSSLISWKNGSTLNSTFLEQDKLKDIQKSFNILEIIEDPQGLNYLAVLQKRNDNIH